ncbi:helix-turn-helix domain-containing protein [Haloglomus salinum]|jgi:predicted DNA binding protein|uniref:helix-turn-helix domain-containing protein n=1 Tax=Haloglomus salinum TaxID=2962673 RepID=UPI0020C98105|nr:helix-turn-helix domain-containing protein [Haloglomus salinum]
MAAVERSTTRLTLDLWHPNCWAIEATGKTGGGVLAHAIYNSPRTDGDSPTSVQGLFTAFGETEAEVEHLLDAIADSEYAGDLSELQERFGRERSAPGNVVREFFLEYDPADMVCPTLLEYGFVHSAPVRIENGREEWQVCFVDERSKIEDALDAVRDQAGAEVEVDSITTGETSSLTTRDQRLDTLTVQQRQVFEHARQAGYYEWPRATSTRELAAEFDVSKTTLLEHLRKAEAKLLDP